MEPALAVVVVLALFFAWTNGFHDAANSVATSLTTGALTPRVALPLSAVLNVVGALLGVGIAELVGSRLLLTPVNHPGLGLVAGALVAAIGWNLLTWYRGLPSSSSHALLGALAGAGTAAGVGVDWPLVTRGVLLPMLVSPVLGFVGAWLLMLALLRGFRDAAHGPAIRRFRMAQGVSAAAMSVGHGLQDGQKTMGVLLLALVAAGQAGASDGVPLWARLLVSVALGLGTLSGGWRIIRTLSRRIAKVDPTMGFAAEAVAATILYAAAGPVGVPVSSTHTVTTAIVGASSAAGARAIRWATVRRIGVAWLATPLLTFAVAWLLVTLGARLGG